jgi:adenylate cyclase
MVDRIQEIDQLALGGERRLITVMYVDVRGFDKFSERLTPRQLMDSLNTYLTIASEGIHHHAGMIDKYMGSEIMSLFNTQLNPDDDHAWQALQAALRIAADLTTLATYMQAGDTNQAFYRIGVHTGIATLGNVGSTARREFTAIGDNVNLAKRLQENAKLGQILISEDTLAACQKHLQEADHIRVEAFDTFQVKGRSQPVTVYDLSDE